MIGYGMSLRNVMHVFGTTEDFPDYPNADYKDYTIVTVDGTDTYMVYGGVMVSLDGSSDDNDPDAPGRESGSESTLPNRGSDDDSDAPVSGSDNGGDR
jgi:hypothetical protein